ncbi:hypothetical protein NQ318_007183 [Aromia moschata]|uniref:Uncharacterized protein n=1 Tax=Aromia moschata TaxID=1265417 RepID=A0AAV8XX50_9CUCU|nr:hypothetical protein NQ318_007183 [Aromia moschata]
MEFQRIDEKSFSGNVKLLKLFGLYPYSSCPKIYPFYAYTFYVLFTCPTPILCIVNLFFLEEKTLQRIVDTFFMITQIGILIVKLLPFKNNPEGVSASMEWLNRGDISEAFSGAGGFSRQSDSIVNAIYMSEWYNYDNKSKKALITLMERAKRPMVVTAGKLLDLSLVTFTTIIRRSYSLLAVLKNYSN